MRSKKTDTCRASFLTSTMRKLSWTFIKMCIYLKSAHDQIRSRTTYQAFFAPNPLKSTRVKFCGNEFRRFGNEFRRFGNEFRHFGNEFWHFGNEFQHFGNEFWHFEMSFSILEKSLPSFVTPIQDYESYKLWSLCVKGAFFGKYRELKIEILLTCVKSIWK